MDSANPSEDRVNAETLTAMARLLGVDLGEERAHTLVAQAEAHFGLMRALDRQDPKGFEVAGQFRLDRGASGR